MSDEPSDFDIVREALHAMQYGVDGTRRVLGQDAISRIEARLATTEKALREIADGRFGHGFDGSNEEHLEVALAQVRAIARNALTDLERHEAGKTPKFRYRPELGPLTGRALNEKLREDFYREKARREGKTDATD